MTNQGGGGMEANNNYWAEEADRLHHKLIKALTELEIVKAENKRLRNADKLKIWNGTEFEVRFEEPKQ